MEELEYKKDVISSRVGCLGGSDARQLAATASLGSVPKGFQKRLAVCKGLVEQDNITTPAMRLGDEVENAIYAHLAANDPRWESNPRWESKKYSRENVTLLCHPDMVFKDEENKVLRIYETKGTKFSILETKQTYKAQIFVENIIGKELASSWGGGWKVKTFLVHYSTEGLNLDEPFVFEPSRLTVSEMRFNVPVFDIARAMNIVNDYLGRLDFWAEDASYDSNLLPTKVQAQFNEIAVCMREIKEREDKVKEFKNKIKDYFIAKGIKKVSCDDFSFTLVAESTTSTVDYKKMFEDEIASKHPTKARKLERKYSKESKRSAYVVIKTKENTNN